MNKPWYKQGSVYSGVALIVIALGKIIAEGDMTGGLATAFNGVDALTLGLTAAGVAVLRLRAAIESVKKAVSQKTEFRSQEPGVRSQNKVPRRT